MLPKSKRISRKLFKPLLGSSIFFNSKHFTLRVAPSKTPRVAVSVSKKVSKKAVVRNKVRRRVYSFINSIISTLSPNLHLLIAKPGSEKISIDEMNKELADLIKKR